MIALPSFQKLDVGSFVFQCFNSLLMKSLPCLECISCASNAFSGDEMNGRQVNRLSWIDLPLLHQIQCEESAECFSYVHAVTVKSIR